MLTGRDNLALLLIDEGNTVHIQTRVVTPQSYQLKVTLKGSHPPIWRRLSIPADMTLAKLHAVLQISMGWENHHMHAFRVGKQQFGEHGLLDGARDERKIRISEAFSKTGSQIAYEYDFGDCWEHEIVLEKIVSDSSEVDAPIRLLEGQRACPPEDCGGVYGYADMIEIMANRKHPEHKQTREWLGEPFKPEHFDPDSVNKSLRAYAEKVNV